MTKKKLYILEYNESYTGGTVVVICKDKEDLTKYLTKNYEENSDKFINDSKPIFDEYTIQLYKLRSLFSYYKDKLETTVEELSEILLRYPLIETDVLKHCTRENGFENGKLRIDWILRTFDFDGLILIEEFDIETDREGIISNTYYCA